MTYKINTMCIKYATLRNKSLIWFISCYCTYFLASLQSQIHKNFSQLVMSMLKCSYEASLGTSSLHLCCITVHALANKLSACCGTSSMWVSFWFPQLAKLISKFILSVFVYTQCFCLYSVFLLHTHNYLWSKLHVSCKLFLYHSIHFYSSHARKVQIYMHTWFIHYAKCVYARGGHNSKA